LGGEIAGLFYSLQLKDPVPRSACIDLAHEVITQLPLRVVSEVYPYPQKQGACIVELRSTTLTGELGVTIDSSPTERKMDLQFREMPRGHFNAVTPIGPAAQMASDVVALTRKHYPEAVITMYKPHYGLLGP
jgi:hypothetical protein